MDIRIVNVTKRFGNLDAVKDVSLGMESGEFFTLLGPSGCGKTTLLRSIAGFNQPDRGEIYFGTKRVDRTPAHKRGVGMVFQNYAIFPHLSVHDNVAYGLKARKVSSETIKSKVRKILETVRLEGYERRLPNQLSGGQLQRVAIARALVIQPQVLLMDEPLSNLDAKLRVEMRGEIRELQQAMRITTIYVTHDQEEALSISDRIAVMNAGVVEQVGKPWEIYISPANRFVAAFIGSTNIFEGDVVSVEGTAVTLQAGEVRAKVAGELRAGHKASFAIRPEAFKLAAQIPAQDRSRFFALKGTVDKVEYLGSFVKYNLRLTSGQEVKVTSYDILPSHLKQKGETLEVLYEPERALVYP